MEQQIQAILQLGCELREIMRDYSRLKETLVGPTIPILRKVVLSI